MCGNLKTHGVNSLCKTIFNITTSVLVPEIYNIPNTKFMKRKISETLFRNIDYANSCTNFQHFSELYT